MPKEQEMKAIDVVLLEAVVNLAAKVALGVLMMVVNNFWMIISAIAMGVLLLVDLAMLIWFCLVIFAITPDDQESRVVRVVLLVGVVNLAAEVALGLLMTVVTNFLMIIIAIAMGVFHLIDLAMLIWFCHVMVATT
ncbi:hypothetical protein AMTR_s00002p00239260 [Amborella trichopoda]|uniref:Uncharacterized protein n=1 Tax=Amborella trichopoda TaxID=13333 RepID=W1P108_AMBTC|nr:hypothetical protein AMTR_s00002p00239260 [Amborella trichopoda]